MAAVITAVVGHRGSGKSQFLQRARTAFEASGQKATFVDVDQEMEQAAGRPIIEFFGELGEEEFRRLEREMAAAVFDRLHDDDRPAFVALGAGFDGSIPSDVAVLWIQRSTDGDGRIFLDRPALDPGLGPLEEFQHRFGDRDDRYRDIATETLLVAEGIDSVTEADRLILGLGESDIGGYLTILPGDIDGWDGFLAKRLTWGIDRFEIRDDLLSASVADRVASIPAGKRLVSYRTSSNWLDGLATAGALVDWALELGKPPPGVGIVSRHHRVGRSVHDVADELIGAGPDAHLKLAIAVNDFTELWQGHQWRSADPDNRSFLPRSDDGRWSWYRQTQRGNMQVNFLREGAGSAADQPTLSDWVSVPQRSTTFAAILGDPVAHSRTPTTQAPFFAQRGMGVVRIRMTAAECTADNMEVLARLGMTHAAVTSPLKKTVYEMCGEVEEPAATLESVNTLVRKGDQWVGTNTDIGGLRALVADVGKSSVVLWGGGGTRATVLYVLAEAVPYSARSGMPLSDGAGFGSAGPDIVVWAVGRNRQQACKWPPTGWRPHRVIDLNYGEDSPGLEYAHRLGAEYRSGLEMFRVQAELQQEFWNGR
ncbi:MAG: shikimate kinase [Acidimicrobiia bacterium]